MSGEYHIPHLKTITDFYDQLQIGVPRGDDFAIMRIEDQPETKRMEMPLFRCNFYRVVFFRNSGVEWSLPDQKFSSSENSICFSYPGKLESWSTSQKIFGCLVCFTEDFAHLDSLNASFDRVAQTLVAELEWLTDYLSFFCVCYFAQAAGLLLSSLDEESKQRNQAKIITCQAHWPTHARVFCLASPPGRR